MYIYIYIIIIYRDKHDDDDDDDDRDNQRTPRFPIAFPVNPPGSLQPPNPPRTPQAFTTEYATGALSGVMGTDQLWLGDVSAKAQQFGLISQEPGGWSWRSWSKWVNLGKNGGFSIGNTQNG